MYGSNLIHRVLIVMLIGMVGGVMGPWVLTQLFSTEKAAKQQAKELVKERYPNDRVTVNCVRDPFDNHKFDCEAKVDGKLGAPLRLRCSSHFGRQGCVLKDS